MSLLKDLSDNTLEVPKTTHSSNTQGNNLGAPDKGSGLTGYESAGLIPSSVATFFETFSTNGERIEREHVALQAAHQQLAEKEQEQQHNMTFSLLQTMTQSRFPRVDPLALNLLNSFHNGSLLLEWILTSNAMLHLHTGSSEDKKWRITEFPNIQSISAPIQLSGATFPQIGSPIWVAITRSAPLAPLV
ncbi:hypothetical protein DAPPUDRAFT_266794 [Daphnia pulex]|uniref:Uncharacterized protein n=1 Tax=Daphnia pulex TaxID=6669 RepID=E9HVJ7_DAPPU|nr:hypothetical protein DAPPUDRAFT_266794 [Daphnia pulex]|eukprot:EFX64234.1 hypothetical protein DAPPUDRAFT_266794 [Daphnia pulex]